MFTHRVNEWNQFRPASSYHSLNYKGFKSRHVSVQKCGCSCSLFAIIILILVFLFLLTCYIIYLPDKIHVLFVETEKVHYSHSDKFLSIALDTVTIADGFKNFDMNNPKLLAVVKALAPGYLRIGGNLADRLAFVPQSQRSSSQYISLQPDGGVCSYSEDMCKFHDTPNISMNGSDWLELNKFANAAGFDIIFDLNALLRFPNGSWDYRNAQELIEFSDQHHLNVNWELGNEPNAFLHQFNQSVSASQLAEDFNTLRQILKNYSHFDKSLIVGPDTTRPQVAHKESEKYLSDFLDHIDNNIDAITWHQYYFNGRTAIAEDFVDPEIFDILKWQIAAVKDIVKYSKSFHKPIWLGETSSAYGSGAPGLSDRYIGSFIWLDKLGLAARMGLEVVIRQSIVYGDYALVDSTYTPNPVIADVVQGVAE